MLSSEEPVKIGPAPQHCWVTHTESLKAKKLISAKCSFCFKKRTNPDSKIKYSAPAIMLRWFSKQLGLASWSFLFEKFGKKDCHSANIYAFLSCGFMEKVLRLSIHLKNSNCSFKNDVLKGQCHKIFTHPLPIFCANLT